MTEIYAGERKGKLIATAIVCLLFASGILLIAPLNASGLVLYVGTGSTYSSIMDALDDAVEGDVIVIASGNYNESISVGIRSITLRGNATASVLISAPHGEKSRITASNVTMAGMTFIGQSLNISSSNVNLTGIAFRSTTGAALNIESSKSIEIDGVSFSGTPEICVNIANSSNIVLGKMASVGSGSTICHAVNVSNITFKDMDIELGAGSKGFVISGDSILFHNSSITSNERAFGIHFQGTDIELNAMIIEMVGTAMHLSGAGIGVDGCVLTMSGMNSRGIELSSCDNVSVNGTALFLNEGARGIEVFNVRDLSLENLSVSMLGKLTSFLNGTHLVRAHLRDLSYSSKGDNQTGISLSGGVVNGTFLLGCVDMTMTRSSFYQGGNHSIIAAISDHRNLRISDGIFMTNGMMTNGIVLGMGRGAVLDSNSHSIRADDSIGVRIGSDESQVKGSTFILWGDVTSGLLLSGADNVLTDSSFTSFESGWLMQLGGSNNEVLYSEFYLNGAGTAIDVLGDIRGGVIEGCSIDQQGPGSVGISSGNTPFHSNNLNIRTTMISSVPDAGHSVITSYDGMTMVMRDVMIWSNSTNTALQLTGRDLQLERIILKSGGPGISARGVRAFYMNNSRIDSTNAMELWDGDYEIVGSELLSSGASLSAYDGADVHVLDSSFSSIDVDAGSNVQVSNTIDVQVLYKDVEPMEGVEILVANARTGTLHSSPYYGGSDPATDPEGKIGPFIALNSFYAGSSTPTQIKTNATLHIVGTATTWDHVYDLDTSEPSTVSLIVPDIDLPQIVINLTAISLEAIESIKLQWDPNDDDTITYRIYAFRSGTWSLSGEVDHPTTSWISSELGPSTRGIFRITAFDGVWEGPPSQPAINVTIDLTPPPMPTSAMVSLIGINSLTITWEIGPEEDLGGFMLEMNTTPSMTEFDLLKVLEPEDRSYTVVGLAPATLYGYRILAFDTSYNYSPFTNVFLGRTEPMIYSLEVTVTYEGGPLSDRPAEGAIVRLLSFNGTFKESALTDGEGKVDFTNLEMGGEYRLEGAPESSLRGEAGVSTGYLSNTSMFISASGANPYLSAGLYLPYYFKPETGSIDVFVAYGEGPRSGAVFNAMIELTALDGSVIENRTTNNLGEATFMIRTLPFIGRFKVTPPDSVAAIPGRRAGYLQKMSNNFEVSSEDPYWGRFEIRLEYMDHVPPPKDLQLLWKSPMGVVRELDTPIRFMFNQPMNTLSVESYTRIDPPLKGMRFVWSNNNQSLDIHHVGLSNGVTYTVTIGTEVRTLEGTGFPQGYTNNTWTFKTDRMIGGVDGIPREAIYAAIAIFAIILIAIGIYIYLKQPREDDLGSDEEEFDPYSYDYLDEEAYGDVDEEADEDLEEEEEELVDEEEPLGEEEGPEDEEYEDGEVLGEEILEDEEEGLEVDTETKEEPVDPHPAPEEPERTPVRTRKKVKRK